MKRSDLGFEDAAEEVIRRTVSAKKAPTPSKFAATVKGIRVPKLRIVPEIRQLRKDWPNLSFRERVERKASLRDITPPGTVGQFLLRDFNEACSTCDERDKRNKPSVLQFARQSFVRQKRKLRLEREGQKVKKEKKKKRRVRKKPLLTEDEADDEGQGQQGETSSEDPGHRPLGRDHGGFDPGASGSAAAVS